MFTSLKNKRRHIIATVFNYIFSGGEPLIQAAFIFSTKLLLTLKLMSEITGEQIQGWHVHRSWRKAELGLINILRWLIVDSLKEWFKQFRLYWGTLTAELVTEIIENQVLLLLPRNSFLAADNASVHNDVALCRILARKNITLVKLPAYSYDLNAIKMVFGLVKAIAHFFLLAF